LGLKKINKIVCFGTSFTAGGGYYFNSKDMEEEKYYYEYYNSLNEFPKTMFNYSYPGQLKKLFNNNVQIENLGKCGYGNDRTSRLIFDLVENEVDLSQYLFLIEFAYMGREELYSNTLNSYVVHNYHINDDLSYDKGTLAKNHKYDTDSENMLLNELSKIIVSYNKNFWNYENQHTKNIRNIIFLVNYLIRNNVNFLVVEGIHNNLMDYLIKNNNLLEFSPHLLDGDKYSMNHYIEDNKLKISDVTNGIIEDYHASLEGNKLIASKIHEHLLNFYRFE
jgi:hypothetical protein